MYSHPKATAIQNNAHRRSDGLAIIPDFTALQSPSRIVIQTHDLYAVWRERSAETCAYPPPDYPRRKNYRVCCIDTQNPRGYKQLKLDKCPPRAGCYTPFGPPRTCAGAVESRLFRFYIPCIILLIGSYRRGFGHAGLRHLFSYACKKFLLGSYFCLPISFLVTHAAVLLSDSK